MPYIQGLLTAAKRLKSQRCCSVQLYGAVLVCALGLGQFAETDPRYLLFLTSFKFGNVVSKEMVLCSQCINPRCAKPVLSSPPCPGSQCELSCKRGSVIRLCCDGMGWGWG